MSGIPRTSWRIFLVEDDAWIRTFLRDVLSDEGYLVSEAADGRTALRMVQERVPDLMLLDLAMPEVTGREVLHELRRNRRTRNLPVLVMSAYTRVLPPDEAGFASGVISKPLVVANLLEEIRRVLGEEGSNRSTPSK
jgi:CheY-like chemotaxis protein